LKKILFRVIQKILFLGSLLLPWKEPALLIDKGSIKGLAEIIRKDGFSSCLIVTDKILMKLNLLRPLFDSLDREGVKYELYDETLANPTLENVEEALRLYTEKGCQAIIAFGGGSPMDCAKGVGARIARPKKKIEDMRGYIKVMKKPPALYAVPTTAGTGSEATITAVFTNVKTHEKFAVSDPYLRPKYAVLDPELTVSLPPHITSITGMDALTHAVEAYIGHSNTKSTKEYALKAVKLIFENIEKAYEEGEDITARQNMLVASYLAGLAFTRAYIGYAHAIAHSLGGIYKTPHGLANAVLLPEVIEFYGKTAHKKLAQLADAAGLDTGRKTVGEKAQLFIDSVRGLNERLNISSKLDIIKREDIPLIAKRAYKEASPTYPVPRILKTEELEDIIYRISSLPKIDK